MASKGLNTFKDPNAFLEGKWFSSHLLGLASTSQPFYPRVLSGFWPIAKYQKWSGVVPLSQCGFGSVRFRFLVFATGPVRFMFGFGSCGSWSISVRFGVWNILQWYLLFFRRRKSKYRLLPTRGLFLPATGFMSSGFQRAERAELGKPKLPEIVSACNLLWRNPYLLFSLNSNSNYNFSNPFIGGG